MRVGNLEASVFLEWSSQGIPQGVLQTVHPARVVRLLGQIRHVVGELSLRCGQVSKHRIAAPILPVMPRVHADGIGRDSIHGGQHTETHGS